MALMLSGVFGAAWCDLGKIEFYDDFMSGFYSLIVLRFKVIGLIGVVALWVVVLRVSLSVKNDTITS